MVTVLNKFKTPLIQVPLALILKKLDMVAIGNNIGHNLRYSTIAIGNNI